MPEPGQHDNQQIETQTTDPHGQLREQLHLYRNAALDVMNALLQEQGAGRVITNKMADWTTSITTPIMDAQRGQNRGTAHLTYLGKWIEQRDLGRIQGVRTFDEPLLHRLLRPLAIHALTEEVLGAHAPADEQSATDSVAGTEKIKAQALVKHLDACMQIAYKAFVLKDAHLQQDTASQRALALLQQAMQTVSVEQWCMVLEYGDADCSPQPVADTSSRRATTALQIQAALAGLHWIAQKIIADQPDSQRAKELIYQNDGMIAQVGTQLVKHYTVDNLQRGIDSLPKLLSPSIAAQLSNYLRTMHPGWTQSVTALVRLGHHRARAIHDTLGLDIQAGPGTPVVMQEKPRQSALTEEERNGICTMLERLTKLIDALAAGPQRTELIRAKAALYHVVHPLTETARESSGGKSLINNTPLQADPLNTFLYD